MTMTAEAASPRIAGATMAVATAPMTMTVAAIGGMARARRRHDAIAALPVRRAAIAEATREPARTGPIGRTAVCAPTGVSRPHPGTIPTTVATSAATAPIVATACRTDGETIVMPFRIIAATGGTMFATGGEIRAGTQTAGGTSAGIMIAGAINAGITTAAAIRAGTTGQAADRLRIKTAAVGNMPSAAATSIAIAHNARPICAGSVT